MAYVAKSKSISYPSALAFTELKNSVKLVQKDSVSISSSQHRTRELATQLALKYADYWFTLCAVLDMSHCCVCAGVTRISCEGMTDAVILLVVQGVVL